ncbi:MAG TPA: hypothetical protein VMX13_04705 [Sedimentisphaerales bacterium]|nr:hypothetical protein [Sedimentisphaerales bacterium]
MNDFDAYVVGYRGDIPSNCAAVHLAGNRQSEIYGVPFSRGLAPNWTAWSTSASAGPTGLEQGRKYQFYRGGMSALSSKPYYQVIKATPRGTVHGIWRKFLGLTPGHTYRLTAHLTTLEMDSIDGDWALAVCASHNGADGKDLTAEQMAGEDALPDGSKGLEAARVALYDNHNTTRRMWETTLTGYKAGRRPAGSHIVLPAGVDTITVWVRFSCSDPSGQVAFSGVALEDVTAGGDRLKTPEKVIEENRAEQGRRLDEEGALKEKAARNKKGE